MILHFQHVCCNWHIKTLDKSTSMTFIYLHYSNHPVINPIWPPGRDGHRWPNWCKSSKGYTIRAPMGAALTEGRKNNQESSPNLLFQEKPVQAVRCQAGYPRYQEDGGCSIDVCAGNGKRIIKWIDHQTLNWSQLKRAQGTTRLTCKDRAEFYILSSDGGPLTKW